MRQVFFLDTEKYLRGRLGRSDVWKNLNSIVIKNSAANGGGSSWVLHLISRFALNLPQLNYILSDGYLGTFEEVQNLNKQALFALRFQRTPEDIITFSSENPNVEDFVAGGQASISWPETLQKLESTASLYPRSKINNALQTKYYKGSGSVGMPKRLGFTLNNNLTEALNFHLPDGRTLGELVAKLHATDRSDSNLASRVLYQMVVEADDLRYP